MIKYIALLRGINVGGNKLIKMADLRELFEQAGFKNVRTYIQSGNVVFESNATEAGALARKIEKKIHQTLGHEVTVILMTATDLEDCVKCEPFKAVKAGEDVMKFVTFLAAEPANKPRTPFINAKENVEVLGFRNRALFLVCRRKKNGMFEFPNALFEKELEVSATTRNWTTVTKILELAEKT